MRNRKQFFMGHPRIYTLCYVLYIVFIAIPIFFWHIALMPALLAGWLNWNFWGIWVICLFTIPIPGSLVLGIGQWFQGFDECDKEIDWAYRHFVTYPNPDIVGLDKKISEIKKKYAIKELL